MRNRPLLGWAGLLPRGTSRSPGLRIERRRCHRDRGSGATGGVSDWSQWCWLCWDR